VYVAAVSTAKPTAKAAGATPASWTDLGSIEGSVATLDKADPTVIAVETGLFEILRAEVAKKDGDATCKFQMVEYEPAAWAALTGDTTHVVGSTGVGIWVGGRPLIQSAILLVAQNPIGSFSEFHHYSPAVDLSYKPVAVNSFQGIEVTIRFLKYLPSGDSANLNRDFEIIYYA
jgi:hypothetical protein